MAASLEGHAGAVLALGVLGDAGDAPTLLLSGGEVPEQAGRGEGAGGRRRRGEEHGGTWRSMEGRGGTWRGHGEKDMEGKDMEGRDMEEGTQTARGLRGSVSPASRALTRMAPMPLSLASVSPAPRALTREPLPAWPPMPLSPARADARSRWNARWQDGTARVWDLRVRRAVQAARARGPVNAVAADPTAAYRFFTAAGGEVGLPGARARQHRRPPPSS